MSIERADVYESMGLDILDSLGYNVDKGVTALLGVLLWIACHLLV